MAAEIDDVLQRPRLSRYVDPTAVAALRVVLSIEALRFEPVMSVRDCRDAKDNKILELALAADADMTVASDRDLLVLHPWRGIAILTPAEFVARFGG